MKNRSKKFCTQHTAAGIVVHIDGTSVAAIGYMPQDVIGKSMLDFYHPDDLVLVKSMYEMVMKSSQAINGKFLSKPYRFLARNGCYITLETEWTGTFNPWTRKLEFITGNHSVLRGINTIRNYIDNAFSKETNHFQK